MYQADQRRSSTAPTFLGVITPHAAAGPETEWPLAGAGRIITRIVRIPAPEGSVAEPGTPPTSPAGLRALTSPAVLEQAVASFAPGSVEAIGYASTSTGYAIGHPAESALLDRLSQNLSIPVDGTSAAAVTALRGMEIERLELVHPPWFDEELNELAATYFLDAGFDVVASRSADLPRDPHRIEPDEVRRWISEHVSDEAQALFIGGNGFRVAPALDQIEQQLGRPVLASNQVLLWSLLGKAGAGVEISGYGSLFQPPPAASAP
jgi:maleate isomerase